MSQLTEGVRERKKENRRVFFPKVYRLWYYTARLSAIIRSSMDEIGFSAARCM